MCCRAIYRSSFSEEWIGGREQGEGRETSREAIAVVQAREEQMVLENDFGSSINSRYWIRC